MIYEDYCKLIQGYALPQSLTLFVCFVSSQPSYINARFSWKGVSKPQGSSFYVGTSPAFEMALYTACFFGEPGDCTCNIDGRPLAIKTIDFGGTGKVLTSYPTA